MLRAQDRKSNKRVRAMINMSKGASKAVLEDAKVGLDGGGGGGEVKAVMHGVGREDGV